MSDGPGVSEGGKIERVRLRGPLLLPGEADDCFEFIADGALLTDGRGVVDYAGAFAGRPSGAEERSFERVGLLMPALVDCHTHVPQWPIRGRFLEGVRGDEPGGALLAGLERNVFPAEGRCGDVEFAVEVSRRFLADTRANGTLGGVVFMTSHPVAARAALQVLPASWRVGLVLMDQNCPAALSISVGEAVRAYEGLVRDFGQRVVLTDRFAVACSSRLRRAGTELARKYGLDAQTHLAEQPGEIAKVRAMYPEAASYAEVYERDGLLEAGGAGAIAAHCIHLSEPEWRLLSRRRTRVAHCPVSNTLLGSGVMPLEEVYRHGLDWALCTDVGASPTTSLLAEATHFVGVHAGRTERATGCCALWRATTGARRVGRVEVGGLREGELLAAVEITSMVEETTAEDVIRRSVLGPIGRPVGEIATALAGRVGRVWG